jgi:hypothetical protein
LEELEAERSIIKKQKRAIPKKGKRKKLNKQLNAIGQEAANIRNRLKKSERAAKILTGMGGEMWGIPRR